MIFQTCLKLHSDKLEVAMITLGSVMILLVDQRTPMTIVSRSADLRAEVRKNQFILTQFAFCVSYLGRDGELIS